MKKVSSSIPPRDLLPDKVLTLEEIESGLISEPVQTKYSDIDVMFEKELKLKGFAESAEEDLFEEVKKPIQE